MIVIPVVIAVISLFLILWHKSKSSTPSVKVTPKVTNDSIAESAAPVQLTPTVYDMVSDSIPGGQGYFITLQLPNNDASVMLDTGSAFLNLKTFNDISSVPITTNKYDILTVYGGNKITLNQCITQNSDECSVQKLYNTHLSLVSGSVPITVFNTVYGTTPNILGLATTGLNPITHTPSDVTDTQGKSLTTQDLISWNNTIRNFSFDFPVNKFTLNDNLGNMTSVPRQHVYGYKTDFYMVNVTTKEMGNVLIALDTGTYDCIVPANIDQKITGQLTITAPFQAVIDKSSPTYQKLGADLNFIILGNKHFNNIKIGFDKDNIYFSK